jgi:hypothetical protein
VRREAVRKFAVHLFGVCSSKITSLRGTPAINTCGETVEKSNLALESPTSGRHSPFPARVTPCILSDVLELAGARANELVTSLQNFTAEEKIEYQAFDRLGYMQDHGADDFHYTVDFQQLMGATTLQESRTPAHGGRLSAPAAQDVGLPEIALMFLPEIQADYEISCEGTIRWGGQVTWVVHFQQRKDKPSRTLSFRGVKAVYPARLKGRAWVSSESGEVTHIETALMEEISLAKVRRWYLSLDYAPVQFRTRKVTISLPQTVDAYCEFDDHRTIVYHTFTNFMLFSIQTDGATDKPKEQP